MKPLKDYVEIIFAVLALAGLVFVFWYFLVAVPAKKAEQSGTFVMVPGTEMEVCRGTVTGVFKDHWGYGQKAVERMSSTTIYLKLPQVKEVYEPEVYLGMIADVHSSDRAAEAKAKAVKITSFSGKGKEAVFVGNVMELVEKIEKTGQNIQVDNVGESDFVVTYRAGKKKSLVWEWMKTAMVSAVAFFGAAFAIMTFNNDANVTDVFAKFYEMIIGTRADGPTILEASYSVGLALGILLFFNHFASWKITVDPTPIEVEMRLYEENLNKTLIKNGGRKESGVDVS